jgi:hypothetical protein
MNIEKFANEYAAISDLHRFFVKALVENQKPHDWSSKKARFNELIKKSE